MYLAVANDETELPLAVADTQKELAQKLGVTKFHISRCVAGKKGFNKRSTFRVYRIEEEENGETT